MQIFPRSLNALPLAAGAGTVVGLSGLIFFWWYFAAPANLQVGYQPEQPVPYSHRLHAGDLGIDCRYCHANIERSQEAMIPPTQTCMGCHAIVRKDSPLLAKVRESWETGKPIEWVRVHKLPEHAYFDHSVHLAVGVGCVSCHGRIDRMDVVRVARPLSMQWCLDCHRNPSQHLRGRDQITVMCGIEGDGCREAGDCCSGECSNAGVCTPIEIAAATPVAPPTHCSGCHR